jgi:uncharacterized protein (DUF1800 family)
VRAVLIDDEARDPNRSTDPSFGKLREPLVRFLQWARSFKLSSTSGDWQVGNLGDNGTRLGQSPLRAPSVFNWFRPGFAPAGTAIGAAGLVAPEFQIADESSVAGYLNFMQSAIPALRNHHLRGRAGAGRRPRRAGRPGAAAAVRQGAASQHPQHHHQCGDQHRRHHFHGPRQPRVRRHHAGHGQR